MISLFSKEIAKMKNLKYISSNITFLKSRSLFDSNKGKSIKLRTFEPLIWDGEVSRKKCLKLEKCLRYFKD